MLPLTDWSAYDGVIAALFGLIVACLLVQHWQRRSGASAPVPPKSAFEVDVALLIVFVGSLLPWWPWLRDLIVLVGCVLWLGAYAVWKWRSSTRVLAEE